MANKPEDAPIGWGIAKIGKNKVDMRKKYNESVLEAAVIGEPHPDFEEWEQAEREKQKIKPQK